MMTLQENRNFFGKNKKGNALISVCHEMDAMLFFDIYLHARAYYFNDDISDKNYAKSLLDALFEHPKAVTFIIDELNLWWRYSEALMDYCEDAQIRQAIKGYDDLSVGR